MKVMTVTQIALLRVCKHKEDNWNKTQSLTHSRSKLIDSRTQVDEIALPFPSEVMTTSLLLLGAALPGMPRWSSLQK